MERSLNPYSASGRYPDPAFGGLCELPGDLPASMSWRTQGPQAAFTPGSQAGQPSEAGQSEHRYLPDETSLPQIRFNQDVFNDANPYDATAPPDTIHRSRSMGSRPTSIIDGADMTSHSTTAANEHLSRALQQQANALAGITRHRSTGHARGNEHSLPSRSAAPRTQHHKIKEQIMSDEDLARKLSLEELRNAESVDVAPSPHRQGLVGHESGINHIAAQEGGHARSAYQGGAMHRPEPIYPHSPTSYPPIAQRRLQDHPLVGDELPVLRHYETQSSQGSREPDDPALRQPHPYPERPSEPIPSNPDGHHKASSLDLPDHPIRSCPTPVSARAVCNQCNFEQNSVSFCPVCAINYCEDHWQSQPLHQMKTRNDQRSMYGVPHERTDPNLVQKIMSIIEPTTSEQEQQMKHLDDDNTSWFGVQADSAGELHFHDWGRYEEFLTQSKAVTKKVQFPSLISFVGPTGAGKSTIVKALVKLFESSRDLGPAQAPVVGLTENQAVPTSGAVHLYWDHESMFGERPLLFADCEGLGGGSREPMSERAASAKQKNVLTKDKKEKGSRPRGYSRGASTDNAHPDLYESQHRKPFNRTTAYPGSPPPPLYPGRSSSPNPPLYGSGYHRNSVVVEGSLVYSPLPSLASQSTSPYSPVVEHDARGDGFTPGSDKSFRGFTRPVKWAIGDKRNRQYIVENLYPRLLYTFSDAVILVMRNAKQLEGEVERLIGWAASAIERSSNQPVLPFAIIVLNAADNRTNEEMLDVGYATQYLLADLDQSMTRNTAFVKWTRFWHERGRDIYTLKDLLTAFYSDIRVVLIPEKGRPGQVHRQYRVLREEIQRAAYRSQRRRQRANLLLNSVQFNPYLQIAYEHFSATLDSPFDFMKASSFFYDIAQDSNPLLSLIRACFALWPKDTSQQVLIPLTPLIASAMMLDVIRRELKGDILTIFPNYQKQLKEALKSFLNEAWPCEALHPKLGERCVVVQATHKTKGHQLENGKVWSGDYCSSQPSDIDSAFVRRVRNQCQNLWKRVMSEVQDKGLSGTIQEQQIAFEIHQRDIIRAKCDFLHGQRQLVSHSICLCCVYGTPSYPLLCGHVVCDSCFKAAAGKSSDDNLLRLYWCPVCIQSWGSGQTCVEVVVKPADAGVRVLSLDGGGIRAIIELTVLKLLEERIGFGIPIREFFDLMVGTSGGGIVALAIGEKNMSIQEASSTFKSFAFAAFKARKGVDLPIVGKIIQLKYQAKYETRGLEQSLRNAFGSELLFGGRRQVQSSSRCRVAVTSIDTNNEANLIANYHRRQRTTSLYSFQRWEQPKQELKVWEAARATSAAPGFFKGFFKGENGHTYWDGALRLNNPVFCAEDERHNIWPESSKSMPDILLSLGTGTFPDSRTTGGDPGPRFGINVVAGVRAYVQIGKDLISNGLDCERIWENYIRGNFPEDGQKYTRLRRLNLPVQGQKVDLDAVDSMERLEEATEQYFSRAQNLSQENHPARQLDDIAGQLIATLFYFEVQSLVRLTIWGTIKCRLPRPLSREGSLARLASGLKRMNPHKRFFRIFASTNASEWTQVNIGNQVLDAVTLQGKAFELPVKFDLLDQGLPSTIFLHLDRAHWRRQTISGFPRLVQPREVVSPVPSRASVGSGPSLSRLNSDATLRSTHSITIGGDSGGRGQDVLAKSVSAPMPGQLPASVEEGLQRSPTDTQRDSLEANRGTFWNQNPGSTTTSGGLGFDAGAAKTAYPNQYSLRYA